jgi:hypothetical protein
MTSLDRRSVLRLGAAAVAAASAGCLVDGETDEDPFAEWIPADSDGILTAHVDLDVPDSAPGQTDLLPLILPSRDDGDGPAHVPQISGLSEIDDPLLTVPIGLGGRVLAATIGLYAAGLGYLVDPERPAPGASDLVFVNGVVGVAGDIDVERARDRLTGGTEGMIFHDPFERTGEYAGYDLYAPATDVGEAVVALDGSAVLMADTRDEIEPVVDAASGEVDRAVDESDRFGWLVDEAGGGHFTVGWVGDRDFEELFWGNAEEQLPVDFVARHDALFTSMTLDPESGESTAELAAAGIDGETARDRLEARLGTATDDLELSVAGDRVAASATYDSDALDVEFRGGPRGRVPVRVRRGREPRGRPRRGVLTGRRTHRQSRRIGVVEHGVAGRQCGAPDGLRPSRGRHGGRLRDGRRRVRRRRSAGVRVTDRRTVSGRSLWDYSRTTAVPPRRSPSRSWSSETTTSRIPTT